MEQDEKQCPYCGETIKIQAKKCRFCGTWLDENKTNNSQEKPTTKNCPVCGEEILFIAKKCKFCGEYLEQNNFQNKVNNPVIYKLADMQKTSNIIWKILSIVMIIFGLLVVAFNDNEDFLSTYPYGSGFAIFNGIGLFILGIYNIIHIPNELPEKILQADSYVVRYYENNTNFIIALIINIILFWIGAVLVGFDMYIRSIVMKNQDLFVNNKY